VSTTGSEEPSSTAPPGAAGSPLPDRPAQAVGFLLSQLGFETARRFGLLMAEVELEPRQFALMRAIAACEGQSQNAIGGWLRIPASSMVAVIDHPEARVSWNVVHTPPTAGPGRCTSPSKAGRC